MGVTEPNDRLSEASRIRAIEDILSAHDEEDWEFDRFTRLAGACLNAPICLVSLVTADRQVFPGACGLPEELDAVRETPLSHSICQHAVTSRSMLVIGDTTRDPLVCGILSVTEYGIRAYLGCPLMTHDGTVLGSFCAIDHAPREWTPAEIDCIRDFSALVVDTIDARVNRERHRSAFDVVLHDLKSPMSGILMASELLKERSGDISKGLMPLVDSISEEGAKALRLVEYLATENRQETIEICPDPGKRILAVVERFRPMANDKSITLETDLDDCAALSVGPWILEQVIENLLSNAIKYSPADSTVRVASRISGRTGHFTIADEGPGFTPDDRKKIYRRYMRLSAAPTGNETSTGLGLSIVKRLIDQHGGRIELLPDRGTGAEFLITFALCPESYDGED